MEEDTEDTGVTTPHTEGLNGFSHDCKAEDQTINGGNSNHKSIMNGVLTLHSIPDHPDPSSAAAPPLSALPISALKQNGLLQSLAMGGEAPKAAEEDYELERAREEWEAVEGSQPALGEDSGPVSLISFNEALQHFQTTDFGDVLKNIQPTIHRTGLAAITHFLFGPPRLHRHLLAERDLVFAIAQCPLDTSQVVHMRVLQTVYRRLLDSRMDCPRYGDHWENIGFQGTDPATDLRGTGFLGLMHTLYFVMDPETLPLARDIYTLSLHPQQNFPFCVMSINMTRIALHVLREEALSKECNRRQQVVGVLNDFYVATFLHLYQLWRSGNKTIHDSGFVLKEVELFAKKNPKLMLRRLELFLKERRSGDGGPSPDPQGPPQPSPSLGGARGTKSKEMHFTGVCDLPPDMEGEARLI